MLFSFKITHLQSSTVAIIQKLFPFDQHLPAWSVFWQMVDGQTKLDFSAGLYFWFQTFIPSCSSMDHCVITCCAAIAFLMCPKKLLLF